MAVIADVATARIMKIKFEVMERFAYLIKAGTYEYWHCLEN